MKVVPIMLRRVDYAIDMDPWEYVGDNKGVKVDMKDVQNGLETTGDSAAHIRQRQERF